MAVDLDGPNSAINVNTIETYSGSTLTLGKSGDAVTLGSGVTTSGFQKDGAIAWDSSIKSANTSITSGAGFFVDTTSAAITITLPASPSVGDIVGLKDYAGTFGTNNLTIARNGSNIQGNANDSLISTNRASVVLVYADATRGWLYTVESNVSELVPTYIVATGGTITTDGDFKVHTFTSSGTFTVTSLGNPIGGPNTVEYLVVAGGAGGGLDNAGGGGAGGFRTNYPSSPGFSVSAQAYPITVGSGGAGRTGDNTAPGGSGGNSVFSSITSSGGGGGGSDANGPSGTGSDGGSGGGGAKGGNAKAGGSGNTPSVSPPQGNPGGSGAPYPPAGGSGGGGGGGASASGQNGPEASPAGGGAGGDGTANSITGSPVTRAGGGGGGSPDAPGAGGAGGGGNGGSSPTNNKSAGTANTGGGGGGGTGSGDTGANGGSGVVIIRYKFQ